MEIIGLSKIRTQVLQQALQSGEDPIDIVFSRTGKSYSMSQIELQGDFPPSCKYEARKKVCESIFLRMVPELNNASEIVYFSFDSILNVDYCLQIIPNSNCINLYVYSIKGCEICSFEQFNLKKDERIEIERSIKSRKDKTSMFSNLSEKFSKLLNIKKPETLNIVQSSNPISIDTKLSIASIDALTAETSSTRVQEQKTKKKSFVDDILTRLDNENFRSIRSSGGGFNVISLSLNNFANQMACQYQEWNGLFEIVSENDHIRVTCLKGFEDYITCKAIPLLWSRKSFIENCILFGVEKIIFLDPLSRSYDMVEVSKIDYSTLA